MTPEEYARRLNEIRERQGAFVADTPSYTATAIKQIALLGIVSFAVIGTAVWLVKKI